jgi:hypothetical protein
MSFQIRVQIALLGVLTAATLVLFPVSAYADDVYLYVRDKAHAQFETTNMDFDQYQFLYGPGGPIAMDSGLLFAPGGGYAQAKSRASYGSLGVYGYSAGTAINASGNSSSVAAWQDEWLFDAGSLNGTYGTVTLTYALEGSTSRGGQGFAYVYLAASSELNGSRYLVYEGTGGGMYTVTWDILFGSPMTFRTELQVQTSASWFESGTANFYDSALCCENWEVRDAGGNIVSYTLTTASGHDYRIQGGTTPEPSTLATLGIALVAAGVRLRKKLL